MPVIHGGRRYPLRPRRRKFTASGVTLPQADVLDGRVVVAEGRLPTGDESAIRAEAETSKPLSSPAASDGSRVAGYY